MGNDRNAPLTAEQWKWTEHDFFHDDPIRRTPESLKWLLRKVRQEAQAKQREDDRKSMSRALENVRRNAAAQPLQRVKELEAVVRKIADRKYRGYATYGVKEKPETLLNMIAIFYNEYDRVTCLAEKALAAQPKGGAL